MKTFTKTMDELSWIVKLILAIPVLDIIWNVYRFCKSYENKSLIGCILAVLLIIPGAVFVWVVDIISILVFKKVLWID